MKHLISFEDFKKLDLRVGRITKAEKVAGSEKLVKLSVNIGQEELLVIAGIALQYQPEDLAGKEIIIVVNLEPRKLMGLESQGMLLAADGEEGPVLIVPGREVLPGTIVR